MNKIAEIMYGKVANLYETSRTLEEMRALFVPAALLVDVTNVEDIGIGYAVDYGSGLETPNFIPPPKILPETLEEKMYAQAQNEKSTLKIFAEKAMFDILAGGDVASKQAEYKEKISGLDDGIAYYIPDVFAEWSGNSVEYKKDERVVYNGVLYKVLQDHTSQSTWTPTDAPSLFAKVLTSSESILEWEQPTAENAYMKGDRVRFNGKVYESLIDNNVWKPDEYADGWKEVVFDSDF